MPGKEFEPQNIDVYTQFLLDLPFEAAKMAVRRLIAERPYSTLPAIGEIRRATAQVLLAAPSPAEAVGEVREQLRTVGLYGTPRFSHPLIRRAVDAADWRHLCMSEEPTVSMAQFRRLYEDLLEAWTVRVQVQGLAALERLGIQPAYLPASSRQALAATDRVEVTANGRAHTGAVEAP